MKVSDVLNSSPQLELTVVLAAVFFCSVLGTALMRHLGGRYGWVVLPRADRWHTKPTALHGGVGFFPAFLLGAVWLFARNYHLDWDEMSLGSLSDETRLLGALLAGCLIMFLFGLWDDLKQCRPATKLVFQLVAASLFVSAGGVFPLTGVYMLDVLVTYFWFIGITNAVNMLDNMDGLSSGVVILAGGTLVILALGVVPPDGKSSMTVHLGLVFITALLGFWVFNRPPASIFMGDSGSLFIGYGLAGIAVPNALNEFMGIINRGETVLGPVFALLIPATVLAVPIFDTTLVTITRKWKALKATEGGRDHSSHRLVGLGLSEKKTVWLLYSFAAFGGAIAVIMQRFSQQSLPVLGFFVIVLVLSGVYLGHVKVQRADPIKVPPTWTPLVTEIFYKRRAAEVLLDMVLIVICFYGAYLLRFDGEVPAATKQALMVSLPLIVPSCLTMYFLAGIYRGQWRLISVSDLPSYAFGVFGGAAVSLAVVTLVTRFSSGHSRSAYVIFALLAILGIVGSRLSFRLFDSVFAHNRSDAKHNGRRLVLIYGAARAGKILHDEIASNPEFKDYIVVGFIDHDPGLTGHRLCGVPVKKESEWIRQTWNRAPEIWISSKFISDSQGQALAQQWNGLVTVRRVHLRMENVEYCHEETKLLNRSDVVRARHSHNKTEEVPFHSAARTEHGTPYTGLA